MLTIRAMSDGRGYSSRHLEHSDYYAEGEHVIGRWHGQGAEILGIEGEVTPGDFESLRQGMEPETGNFLRQRRSGDRISADGTTQSHGRHLYDFTISAPKSVSVMADLGNDKRLIEAHQKAVFEALNELEFHAATRVRQKQANKDRTTGNLVIAVYHHDTSRELDPQLHTHAVAANLTYDSAEGRWKALQASGIYERRAYLTEVYRNALAREVRRLGYEIATKASLQRERQMIDAINRGIGTFGRLGGSSHFVPAARLSPEQRQVVEYVLDSRDRAVNISGAAGTGKTATLEELRRGLHESGQQVLALAPTRSAVEELHKVGFKDAVTIERLLQDHGTQADREKRNR